MFILELENIADVYGCSMGPLALWSDLVSKCHKFCLGYVHMMFWTQNLRPILHQKPISIHAPYI